MYFPKIYSYARAFINTATTLDTNLTDQDFHTGKCKLWIITDYPGHYDLKDKKKNQYYVS